MPTKRQWLIVEDFDWSPRPNVVMAFKAGEIREGLPRACVVKAGHRVEEIRDR